MPTVHAIRLKILGPLAAALGLMLFLVLADNQAQYRRFCQAEVEHHASYCRQELQERTDEALTEMRLGIEMIRQNRELIQAMRQRNRDALLSGASPLLDQLHRTSTITHLYFHAPDQTNVLRVHEPSHHGDLITRRTTREAARTGTAAWGHEQGPFGTYTFRLVVPWREGGELLGFLELGKEFEDIAAELREDNDRQSTALMIVLNKASLNRETWIKAAASKHVPASNWNRFPTALVITSTIDPHPPQSIMSLLADPDYDWSTQRHLLADGDRLWQTVMLPIQAADGRHTAQLIILRDFTEHLGGVWRQTMLRCLGFSALAIVMLGGFHVLLGRVQTRLSEASEVLARQHHERLHSLELQHALEAAEASTAAKSAFLANMSHEIRTPMTAILGYTELLLDPALPQDDRDEHLHTIRRNGEHLLNVINDILDISKIEAGQMKLEQVRCSPCQIVAEVAALMRVRATTKGLQLNVEYIFPVPESFDSDPMRLRQILMNLVGNAIKFTEQGGVRIIVRSLCLDQSDSTVSFEIVDSGMGMTPEDLTTLFRPFMQVDSSMTRRFGGTGLGLAISRRLAQLLGGDIHVQSIAGQGSTFTLTVPTGPLQGVRLIKHAREAMASPEPVGAVAPERALTGRVLLAEDGPDNQRLIAFLLRKAGAKVTIAGDGRAALEVVDAARRQGEPFDVILMDMQMPVLDGYDATRELRRRGYRGAIVALTAHAMTGDREKCLAAGCDDYLSKPIDRVSLMRTVGRLLDASTAAAAAPSGA